MQNGVNAIVNPSQFKYWMQCIRVTNFFLQYQPHIILFSWHYFIILVWQILSERIF